MKMKKALAKLLAGSLAIGILGTGMAAAAEEAGDGTLSLVCLLV